MLGVIPLRELLIVLLGGLFGWTLGKLPQHYVFVVLAIAILLALVLAF